MQNNVALFLASFTAIVAILSAVFPRFISRHADTLTLICVCVSIICVIAGLPELPKPV